jgi:uncharacterized protein YndB with AHSA1/START domain
MTVSASVRTVSMTNGGAMTELRATESAHLSAPPDEVFALITDVERLPEWNRHVPEVIQPDTHLTVGAEWVVKMHAMGGSWPSRARVLMIDPTTRQFAHRSWSDDGNPSYALWDWQVDPEGDGSRVTVRYELHPKTFWRRTLFARIRHRQLQREIVRSLGEADRLLRATPSRACP